MPSALCPQRQEGWRLDILGGRCCRRGCCGLHTPKLSPVGWTCPVAALPHSLDQTNIPPGLTGDAPTTGVGGFSLQPFCCLWSASLLPYQPNTGPSLALVSPAATTPLSLLTFLFPQNMSNLADTPPAALSSRQRLPTSLPGGLKCLFCVSHFLWQSRSPPHLQRAGGRSPLHRPTLWLWPFCSLPGLPLGALAQPWGWPFSSRIHSELPPGPPPRFIFLIALILI